jgi:hypothetical protein
MRLGVRVVSPNHFGASTNFSCQLFATVSAMKHLLIFMTILAVMPANAAAPRWTYVDIVYLTADSGEETTDGLGIAVSANFVSIWHAGARYSQTKVAGGKNKGVPPDAGSDDESFSFYIGLHPAANDSTDAVLELGYFDETIERRNLANEVVEDRADGFYARAGVRSMLSDAFELNGYIIGEDRDTRFANGVTSSLREFGLQVGGQYYFTPDFSVGTNTKMNIDATKLDIYIRWNF